MNPAIRFGLVTVAVAAFSQCMLSEQPARPIQISAVLCDQVAVNSKTLTKAKDWATRVMISGGVEIAWINVGGCDPEDPSFEKSKWPLKSYLLLIIVPELFPGSATTDVMGYAPISKGSYRRAYVFYNRVKSVSATMSVIETDTRSDSVVLGHVIANEFGHLLLSGDVHTPTGIMRAAWDYRQWVEASAGRLLFSKSQARRIRNIGVNLN